jgi:DNA recombination protein RmuC
MPVCWSSDQTRFPTDWRDQVPTAALVVSILIAGLLAYLVIRTSKDAPDRDELTRLRMEKVRLETVLENERENSGKELKFLEESEERLRKEFENLAGRIFEDRGKVLTEQNRDGITGLLQPFREQLESFRRKVEQGEKESITRNATLVQEIRQLHELSNRISEDANNLARAIKGDTKKQGDWGELIMERVFEASGLQEGREYEKQVVLRDDDEKLNRPDFIIHLPGEKDVIVDSKVSLTAFERFMSCNDDSAEDGFLKQHVESVRSHVRELQAKDYGRLLGNRSLDFVIMCIPLEPAYQTALQADPGIVYDLAGRNVVISGPTTLMITLKLIAQIWRRENENRNAEEIAAKAGKLYDQVALVTDAMAESRRKLTGVARSFDLAMKRLQTGRGNLFGRVEEIRLLGAKVSRRIPEPVSGESADEETAED